MAGFLKNLIFPATDAGANETFVAPSPASEKDGNDGSHNEHSHLLSNGGGGGGGGCCHSHSAHEHSHDHSKEEFRQDNIINEQATAAPTGGNNDNNHVLRRLKMATVLCLTFMVIEVIGGLLAGSLAILSDAAHLMADLASFAVAIVAAHLAARPSTEFHTFGLKRVESLAALFSMSCLAVVSVGLALEAFRRIYVLQMIDDKYYQMEEVDGKLMSLIATIGVLVNVALAAVLGENHVHMPGGSHDHSHDDNHHGSCQGHSHGEHDHDTKKKKKTDFEMGIQRNYSSDSAFSEHLHKDEVPTPSERQQLQSKKKNVNLHAAYLHVMADLAQSVAVLIAGIIIWAFPEWQIVDPIATILFCILVFYSTLGVIRSAVCVLLEEVPPDISWQSIHTSIQKLPGVTDVHDLHVWSISHGISAMSVHVHTKDATVDLSKVIEGIAQIGKANGIQHSTAQVQPYSEAREGNRCITCGYTHHSQECVNACEGKQA